jgi:hypothetical protein
LHGVWVLPNSPPKVGEERVREWDASLEALPDAGADRPPATISQHRGPWPELEDEDDFEDVWGYSCVSGQWSGVSSAVPTPNVRSRVKTPSSLEKAPANSTCYTKARRVGDGLPATPLTLSVSPQLQHVSSLPPSSSSPRLEAEKLLRPRVPVHPACVPRLR